MLSNSEPLPEGTVIMSDNQFDGRGQQQNTWLSEPGKNLTISILFKPRFLAIDRQFDLNIAVSVAVATAISDVCKLDCKIKWPNDIFYGGKKIGGILIENIIAGSHFKDAIVGIGINVNQLTFDSAIEKSATSLKNILKSDIDKNELLIAICSEIERSYLWLKSGGYEGLRSKYLQMLYKYKVTSRYRQNGEEFEAILENITDIGQLVLQKAGQNMLFNFKEVTFVTD